MLNLNKALDFAVAMAREAGAVLRLLGYYYDAALEWLAKAEQGFNAIGEWRGMASVLWIAGQIH